MEAAARLEMSIGKMKSMTDVVAGLTKREIEAFATAMMFVKSQDLPWDEIAEMANFSTAKQARDRFTQTVKKAKALRCGHEHDESEAVDTITPNAADKSASIGGTKKRKSGEVSLNFVAHAVAFTDVLS
nr:hypothetical protein CFP56_79295 [Quercus suber]